MDAMVKKDKEEATQARRTSRRSINAPKKNRSLWTVSAIFFSLSPDLSIIHTTTVSLFPQFQHIP